MSASEIAAGKQLFEKNCSSCHGTNGAGGINVGGATSADLRAPGLEDTYHNNDALIRRAILDGTDQDGKPLSPVMPHWRGTLTDSQVTTIIAFLKTLHS